MEIDTGAVLEKKDVAIEFFLAVHNEDHSTISRSGSVPLRLYSATRKPYIGLRETSEAAVQRAQEIWGKKCSIDKSSLLLLRFQFSYKGFAEFATKAMGYDASFAPVLYKMTYQHDTSGKDYGAWAFHGDVPLQHVSPAGDVLIASEWLAIS